VIAFAKSSLLAPFNDLRIWLISFWSDLAEMPAANLDSTNFCICFSVIFSGDTSPYRPVLQCLASATNVVFIRSLVSVEAFFWASADDIKRASIDLGFMQISFFWNAPYLRK
jgi:hypothetical protein